MEPTTVRHTLEHHPLPGLDAARLKRLAEGGVDTLETVVDAGPERLSALTGFDEKTCVALVRVAQSALVRSLPGVLEFAAPSSESPIERLSRGLEAARVVERVLSLVRKARSHVGRRPEKKRWAESHAKARKQLRKLSSKLESVQQEILSDGLSEHGLRYLRQLLSPLDASLRSLLDDDVRGSTLKRTARVACRARRAIVASGKMSSLTA